VQQPLISLETAAEGCFFREVLLIVSSNLAMPNYTWISLVFFDITHV